MNIVVCVKQILNKHIKSNGFRISDYDRNAIETGIALKNKLGGELIAITMGPASNEEVLDASYLIGADRTILITDKAFSGSDTYATAYVLSKAIEKIGDVGVVICGKKSLDGDTGQVGPQIAADLNITQATYVSEVQEISDQYIVVKAKSEIGHDIYKVRYPCLICMDKKSENVKPIDLRRFKKLDENSVERFSIEDLQLSADETGQKGSKTRVVNSYEPENKKRCEFIDHGSTEENVKILLKKVCIKNKN